MNNWDGNTPINAQLGITKADGSKDFTIITMKYGGSISANVVWSCKDGYALKDAAVHTYSLDDASYYNCMANTVKSRNSFNASKAYLRGHWMKEFDAEALTSDTT